MNYMYKKDPNFYNPKTWRNALHDLIMTKSSLNSKKSVKNMTVSQRDEKIKEYEKAKKDLKEIVIAGYKKDLEDLLGYEYKIREAFEISDGEIL
jgi:hypothetical protein